jgi:hypothetical protein
MAVHGKRGEAGQSLSTKETRIWRVCGCLAAALALAVAAAAPRPAAAAEAAVPPTPMTSDNGIWAGETSTATLVLTKDGSRPEASLTIKKTKEKFDCMDISIGKGGSMDMWCGQKNHGLRTQGFVVRGTFPTLQMQPGGDYSAGSDTGPIPLAYQGPASK